MILITLILFYVIIHHRVGTKSLLNNHAAPFFQVA